MNCPLHHRSGCAFAELEAAHYCRSHCNHLHHIAARPHPLSRRAAPNLSSLHHPPMVRLCRALQFLCELTQEEHDPGANYEVTDHEVYFVNSLLDDPSTAARTFTTFSKHRRIVSGVLPGGRETGGLTAPGFLSSRNNGSRTLPPTRRGGGSVLLWHCLPYFAPPRIRSLSALPSLIPASAP